MLIHRDEMRGHTRALSTKSVQSNKGKQSFVVIQKKQRFKWTALKRELGTPKWLLNAIVFGPRSTASTCSTRTIV
jgi:hypothetical protein